LRRLRSASLRPAFPRRNSMRRSTLSWASTFTAALFLVAFATDGASQSFQGGLRGAVKDANSVIPGVMVTLVNEGTNASRTTASNELGEYVFASVVPGTYTVRAVLQGLQRLDAHGVTIATPTVVARD